MQLLSVRFGMIIDCHDALCGAMLADGDLDTSIYFCVFSFPNSVHHLMGLISPLDSRRLSP